MGAQRLILSSVVVHRSFPGRFTAKREIAEPNSVVEGVRVGINIDTSGISRIHIS